MNDHICLYALWYFIHYNWVSSLIPNEERLDVNK